MRYNSHRVEEPYAAAAFTIIVHPSSGGYGREEKTCLECMMYNEYANQWNEVERKRGQKCKDTGWEVQ